MILTKYIAKNCIVPELDATNKADALKELTHLLFDKKKMTGVGPALDQILAREVTESTGIGRGLAVPHARVTGTKGLVCALGRVAGGMDFTAIDRKPVHVVFLICYPPSEQTTYLNFVATLVRLLGDPENLQRLLTADDADAMYEVLEGLSEELGGPNEEKLLKLKADPEIENVKDAHADLILLARLQLAQEMLEASRTGKSEMKQRIENIRALIAPQILRHYDRLMKVRPPALVPVEGDTCQGCFMKLPSKFVQQVRQDAEHMHTCMNCARYIYVV